MGRARSCLAGCEANAEMRFHAALLLCSLLAFAIVASRSTLARAIDATGREMCADVVGNVLLRGGVTEGDEVKSMRGSPRHIVFTLRHTRGLRHKNRESTRHT